MPIHREPDLPVHTPSRSEESAVRRAPLEDDDAYELQDHEFTLEPEEPTIEARTPLDERTAPWSTMPPVPAWAATSRELLEADAEAPRNDAVFRDDEPTPAVELGSRGHLLALREELAHTARVAEEYRQQIERLGTALLETRRSAAATEAQLLRQNAELCGQVQGQAFLIAELSQSARSVPPVAAPSDDVQPVRVRRPPARRKPTPKPTAKARPSKPKAKAKAKRGSTTPKRKRAAPKRAKRS